MSGYEYTPNPLIIDKACQLWVEMLKNPKFDALSQRHQDDDPNGSMEMAQALAHLNAEGTSPQEKVLDRFAALLKEDLLTRWRWDSANKCEVVSEMGQYHTYLDVDYDPCQELAKAGKEAGVADSRWPWKTSMHLASTSLSLSYGYGAERVYYYPLNGKWLITTLSGSDITKVFEYVSGGSPTFRFEE